MNGPAVNAGDLGGHHLGAFRRWATASTRGFSRERVFALLPDEPVPVPWSYEDGVDYVPTPKHILWGHHYTSIAGAAPDRGAGASR